MAKSKLLMILAASMSLGLLIGGSMLDELFSSDVRLLTRSYSSAFDAILASDRAESYERQASWVYVSGPLIP